MEHCIGEGVVCFLSQSAPLGESLRYPLSGFPPCPSEQWNSEAACFSASQTIITFLSHPRTPKDQYYFSLAPVREHARV